MIKSGRGSNMYRVLGNVTSVESLQNEVRSNGSIDGVTYYEEERVALIEALEQMKETIGYLDENYGENRHLEHDLGGYGIALLSQEDYESYYHKILEHHHMTDLEPEYEEDVAVSPTLVYVRKVFIISSDYAVVILLTKKVGD